MRQYLIIFLILIFSNTSFGQKQVEIPESDVVFRFIEKLPDNLAKFNLKNLQKSTDSLSIRIWQTHEIFTLSFNDSISSDYKIHTTGEQPILSTFNFQEDISQNILDSLLAYGLMEIENEKYRGIDGSFVFFEISTKNKYRLVSFWSPIPERSNDCKTVIQILDMLNKTINAGALRNQFLNSLTPGGYRWGMTSIRIDRFLDENTVKTDFYAKAEQRIRKEFNITGKTNHWEYPSVIINDSPARIADLNEYTEKEVERLDVFKPYNPILALYGTAGSNGVVRLKTK